MCERATGVEPPPFLPLLRITLPRNKIFLCRPKAPILLRDRVEEERWQRREGSPDVAVRGMSK